MRRLVDNCQGCGMTPCLHCTAYEYVCDSCGEDVDTLYKLGGEEYCEECYGEMAFDDAVKANCCQGCGEEVDQLYAFETDNDYHYCKECFIKAALENAEKVD